VDSTNSELKRLIKEKSIKPPFLIYAAHQTAGRGQRQNEWSSAANQNILCSFLLDGIAINDLPFVNNVAALSICKTLDAFGISQAKVKWPNDIFVHEQKIAGILTENVISGSMIKNTIVGIGLNVNQSNNLLDRTVSMASVKREVFSINNVLISLFQSFYELLKKDKKVLLDMVNARLYKKDESVTFLTEEGTTSYNIQAILNNGNLLVSNSQSFNELEHHRVKWQH
jgi:BirA family biotin operon repressor/biotin-[acetyl-CoA-carboxylase] ligase